MTRRRPTVSFFVFAATLGLALAGCSSDEITDPGSSGPIPPATPDGLMRDFELAYTRMDLAGYTALLHDGFDFKFLDSRRDAVQWSRDLEISSSGNMFDGNPGELFDGLISCSGVDSISIGELIRVTPWEQTGPDDPDYPGTEQALYQVSIVFHVDGGENIFTIGTGQVFYVKAEQVARHDGASVTGYFLHGQRDMRPAKGIVDLYWGDIKMMFLPGRE
ncbi:hypothetical protein KKG45_09390 [bacterium]|nr:hypothetical protein [bacterium]MBU1073448.1 hypothetical protein [bacterium]MBU1675842.1 hypothetical protein [bacterium]